MAFRNIRIFSFLLFGIGKTERAFTFARAFAAEYPGGRFLR
jgi:hypothetical protein